MEQPLITIIIPVYKVEAYLDRSVQSVVDQTYKNLEIILVDDGSPDNCPAMCDAWAQKDERIRVIHQANGGLSAARNAGIDAATGDYLVFVDSDDTIHPDCVRLLQTGIQDSDIAMARYDCIAQGQKPNNAPLLSADHNLITGIDAIKHQFDREHEPWQFVTVCCKLYRTELFDGIRFPTGRLFEDEYTTYQLYFKAEMITDFPQTILYHYFDNSSGITHNLELNKYFDEYDAQAERIEFFKSENCMELVNLGLLHFLHSAQWHMLECQTQTPDLDEPRRRRFRQLYRRFFEEARKRKLISFQNNYDYYIIAYPSKRLLYRMRKVFSSQDHIN